jgi:hypothetical protein
MAGHGTTKVLIGVSMVAPLVYESFLIYTMVIYLQHSSDTSGYSVFLAQVIIGGVGMLAHWLFGLLGMCADRNISYLNICQLFLGIISAAYLAAAAFFSYMIYAFVAVTHGHVCSLE